MQAEIARLKQLLEKSEGELGKLSDEMQEMTLRHNAALNSVKVNLEVNPAIVSGLVLQAAAGRAGQ